MCVRFFSRRVPTKVESNFNPSSRRLMGMITGSGSKPTALQVYVPKSFALGVMGKMVLPVFCSVPSGQLQVTSGGGNPRTGQQIVAGTPLLALWFVLGHAPKCLLNALC